MYIMQFYFLLKVSVPSVRFANKLYGIKPEWRKTLLSLYNGRLYIQVLAYTLRNGRGVIFDVRERTQNIVQFLTMRKRFVKLYLLFRN
jgi:hypothetical protein